MAIYGTALLSARLLAWAGGVFTGGKKGIADIELLSGMGVMGGALFRDLAIVVKAFGVRMKTNSHLYRRP